jgi:hypothetical protein
LLKSFKILKKNQKTMKKLYKFLTAIAILGFSHGQIKAQCISPTAFGSGTANSTGTVNLTTCAFAGEYSTVTVTLATSYIFNSTGGNGNFITITNNANAVLTSGYAPLGVVIPSVGVYRAHVSTNTACGTESACRTISVAGATFCTSPSQFGSATINSVGNTTVTTCQFGGEFSVNTFTSTGVFTVTSTGGAGNYLTVKNVAGTTIYAQGLSPLVVNIPATGVYRTHLATSGPPTCGTDAACHTVVYSGPAPAGCAGAPAASNAVATPSAICSGANSSMSLSTTYTAAGIAYQWTSASALVGPYTAIPNATLSTYAATSLTTTTFYRAVITCTNGPVSTTATAVQVLVNPNPTVSAVASSTSICFPTTSTLNLTGSGATSYTWSPAASLSSSVGAAVVASPTSNVVYSVVGSFSTGCSASNTIAISANPNPSLTATSASVCANNSVAISVSSSTIAYCQPAYSTGSGFGDYITNVTVNTMTNVSGPLATPFYTLYPQAAATTTLVAGTAYTVNLQAGTYSLNDLAVWIDYNNNGTLNDLGEKLGEVNDIGPAPTIGIITFTVPLTALNGTARLRVREMDYTGTGIMDPCASQSPYGETEDYLITITGGASQFSWTPATYLSSTTGSTVISTPAASTNYTVSTTVNGCVGSATSAVVANITTVAITGNTAICNGGTVSLTASGATTYTWNTSATTASISASPTVNTTYTASGTSSVTGCVGSSTQAVIVNANPTVTAVSSLSLICNGQTASLTASGASTYSWNTSATTSVVAVSPSVTTSYTVTGTNTNSCSASVVITQSVSACTGLNNNVASIIGTVVYPNPNTGLFTIELNNGSVKTIEVMDLTGRIVLTNTSSNDKIDFNISNLANGVYFVKVQSNNSVEVIKIVKQ